MKRFPCMLAVVVLGSSGCASLTAVLQGRQVSVSDVVSDVRDGLQDISDIGKAMQNMTYGDEISLGQSSAGQLYVIYGGAGGDESAFRYVSKVGSAVARVCPRPGIPYFFGIAKTQELVAFSCPGGYIVVSEGLLKTMQDESELAFVLAHEVVHAANKHIEEGFKEGQWKKVGSRWLQRGMKMAAGKLNFGDPDTLVRMGGMVTDRLVEHAFTTEQEMEADKLGLEAMAAAGYDPNAAARVFDRLRAAGAGKASSKWYEHRAAEDRAKYLADYVREKRLSDTGVQNVHRYQDSLKSLRT